MKFSAKFREERSLLLRAKVPFNLGHIPLSSSVSVGSKEDLALQLATAFSFGPVVKLAFKPHDLNPVSIILKSGLGLWGSPNDAPLTVSAEISLSPKVHDRLLSVSIKPRLGDFTIRKEVKNVSLKSFEEEEMYGVSSNGKVHGQNEGVPRTFSFSNGDIKAATVSMKGNLADKEQVYRTSDDSSNAVDGSNVTQRVEWLENEHANHRSGQQGSNDESAAVNISTLDNHAADRGLCERAHENMRKGRHNSASFSFSSAQVALSGWRVVAHSSLPMGSESRLNIRWGMNAETDMFQNLHGNLPSITCANLPSLVLEKISFEQLKKPTMKLENTMGSSQLDLAPSSFMEEDRELSQVSALCHNMKRQLHFMHAENQVLRRAMEDLKSHFDSKGFPKITNGAGKEDKKADLPAQKGKKTIVKQGDVHSKGSSTGRNSESVSKELEKAIFNAQNSPINAKKE
ncbi:hypothetical protein KP509_10G031000 [Ceratopteris richardii]|uniref:Uncharacterized protein n=1 Tax=Ceratopteris richardii TaxID=49495 RepID=A0A8T2U3E8_CERRI|nr:hypothetical protein KP509_10G031000 [Ceratopteris richardii]